jgi:hypothetical protein
MLLNRGSFINSGCGIDTTLFGVEFIGLRRIMHLVDIDFVNLDLVRSESREFREGFDNVVLFECEILVI